MLRFITNMLTDLVDRARARKEPQGQDWLSSPYAPPGGNLPLGSGGTGDFPERVLEHAPPGRSAAPEWMLQNDLPPASPRQEQGQRLTWGDIPDIQRDDGLSWEEKMQQRQMSRGLDLDR